MKTIRAAVGRFPARNNPDDQDVVIALLQAVPPADGGPTGPIFSGPFPGQASPTLTAAISRFQIAHFRHSDGRVDPGGPTLALLNKKTNNGTKPPLPPPKIQQIISAAVGRAPAPNRVTDVTVVMGLLNSVPPSDGGPQSPISLIGGGGVGLNLFGLIQAIEQFQRRQLQGRSDGRVDPGGATLFLLNQKSKFPA